MFRFRTLVLVPLVIVAMSRVAIAAPILFTATLTGAQENPPNASTATGFASFVLNDAQTALTFEATIFGLDFTGSQTPDTAGQSANAHIHARGDWWPRHQRWRGLGLHWLTVQRQQSQQRCRHTVRERSRRDGYWNVGCARRAEYEAGHSVAEYSGRLVLHQFPHYSVWWWRDPGPDILKFPNLRRSRCSGSGSPASACAGNPPATDRSP